MDGCGPKPIGTAAPVSITVLSVTPTRGAGKLFALAAVEVDNRRCADRNPQGHQRNADLIVTGVADLLALNPFREIHDCHRGSVRAAVAR
jgi:hypothetical protein